MTSYSCECVALKKGQGDLYHIATYGEGFDVLDKFGMAKLIAERDRALGHLFGKIENLQNNVAFSKQHVYLNEDKLQFSRSKHTGGVKLDKEVLEYNNIQSKIDLLKTKPQTIIFPVTKTIRGEVRKNIKAKIDNACGIVFELNSEYQFTLLKENKSFVMSACNTKKLVTPNKLKNSYSLRSFGRAKNARPF